MQKVGILDGTGNIGEDFARRICHGRKYDVAIGSRAADKAQVASDGVCTCLKEHRCTKTTGFGDTNSAICDSDILIISLPFKRTAFTIDTIGKEIIENKKHHAP